MEKLRESYIFDISQYSRLDENQIKNLHISPRLTESTTSLNDIVNAANLYKSNLKEEDQKALNKILNKLAEKGFERTFKVWKLPIGRYGNMNGNKRVYPKELWKNVKDKQSDTWKGFCGLCDHPEKDNDPGEFKNQAVIWHDMDVGDDDCVYGYGSFVGPFGHLAQEILEHGGRVGTSSSGFGDVDPITKRVDPNTYVIERLADLVLNPSQGTFGTGDCPHSPDEFLKDVHKGASMDFEKQKTVRENSNAMVQPGQPASQIAANNPHRFNAADPQDKQLQRGQPGNKVDAMHTENVKKTAFMSGKQQGMMMGQQQGMQQGAMQAQQEMEQMMAQQGSGEMPAEGGGEEMPMDDGSGGGGEEQMMENKKYKQVQKSLKERKMGTLTKVEEKAFRKYVQTFIEDANKIENPIQRLNECVDILNCFDEGNCPDLRESLEKQLSEEKTRLEQLVENVVTTEKVYDMDIKKFRESAERNTAQGILLQEQVTDYKELCDGLAKRNIQLKEENENLYKKLNIHNKLSEKKIKLSSREIVNKSSEVESLQEQVEVLTAKNERLIEKTSKLSLSNKEFEKENDILSSKIREAGNIMRDIQEKDGESLQEKQKLVNEIATLRSTIKEQDEIIREIEKNYTTQSKRFDKLIEDFDNYKKEVKDTFDPTARLMPMANERIGKYLNLRENKGIEIESYWNDLKEKYGEIMDQFEDQIRGAKTLREATSNFLKFRTQIDPDFMVAQPAEFAYRSRTERAKLYEHQGIVNPIDSYTNSSTEQKNDEFLKNLRAQGLQ